MLFNGRRIDNIVPLSMVCGTSVLGSWYPSGVGVGVWGKVLGMRIGITRVSSFLRNLRFCKVILLNPSILIWYCQFGRVSMTQPVVAHQQVLWCCIETICPFWSRHRLCAVQLYHSIRWMLHLSISGFSQGFELQCV